MGYENIKLEKGMYNVKGGITKALEQLDPSENYKGTALEGLDAYQRQLKRFDIKVAGAGSDTVEKFFATTDSAALFPEYLTRSVQSGIDSDNVLPSIVATTTHINSMDYRSVISVPTTAQLALSQVAEAASIPETAIRSGQSLVTLKKRGRMLSASYEALRFQRLDLFTVTLRQIGSYIARSQLSDAAAVLATGATGSELSALSKLAYSEFTNLWNLLAPYSMNTIIAASDAAKQMLSLSQFQNSNLANSFSQTGKLEHPFGAEFIRCTDLTAGTVLALDKNYALEMVIAQDVTVDSDRLIDKQLERTAITTITGFSKIFADAVKKLSVVAA